MYNVKNSHGELKLILQVKIYLMHTRGSYYAIRQTCYELQSDLKVGIPCF